MNLDYRPRTTIDAANQLAGESLDSYSQDELAQRIALLEAEIARVAAHRDEKAAHIRAAASLFGVPAHIDLSSPWSDGSAR